MPIPDITKIGEWTPTQLARFIEQTMVNNPPPPPDSLSLSALDVTGDLQLGGNLVASGLISSLSGFQIPGASVNRNTNQSIATGTPTNISFNEKQYNSETVIPKTSPGGLEFKADGFYLIGASVIWAVDNVGRREASIETDGGVVLTRDNRNPVAGIATAQTCSAMIPLEGSILNQTIRLVVSQNSGSSLSITTSRSSPLMWAVRIGDLV